MVSTQLSVMEEDLQPQLTYKEEEVIKVEFHQVCLIYLFTLSTETKILFLQKDAVKFLNI